MSFQGLKNKTMSILREGSKARNNIGELVGTWSEVASDVGVRYQQTVAEDLPQVGAENKAGESRAVVRKAKIWFDLGLDITERDRVEIDGSQFELVAVDADVAGAGHHGAADLLRVE